MYQHTYFYFSKFGNQNSFGQHMNIGWWPHWKWPTPSWQTKKWFFFCAKSNWWYVCCAKATWPSKLGSCVSKPLMAAHSFACAYIFDMAAISMFQNQPKVPAPSCTTIFVPHLRHGRDQQQGGAQIPGWEAHLLAQRPDHPIWWPPIPQAEAN